MDQGLYLEVIRKEPQVGWNLNVGTLPDIKITFNIGIHSSILEDRFLNQYVLLIRLDTKEAVPVTFKSWDPLHKVLIFNPSEPLVADVIYQVTLRKEFPSTENRHMIGDINWAFRVDAAPIGRVSLIDPADATAYVISPTLSWSGVGGPASGTTIYYLVQVHDNWQFGPPPLWQTSFSSATSGGLFSASIGIPLTENTAYYWRVRAYTASLTGDWSDTRSFFIGSGSHASPDTQLVFDPSDFFELVELLPEDGTPHQLTWPLIRVTFSRPLSGASINDDTVQLWSLSADGRLTVPTAQVEGVTLAVSGNVLYVIPPGTPDKNTRYTLRLTTGIRSASGDVFTPETTTYFTGQYFPLYGGTISVRSELGGFINRIGDDEILFYLWRGSLQVNELMLTKVRRLRRYVTFNEIVNYVSPFGETWGMVRYAELFAALQILESFYYVKAEEADRHVGISTYEYGVGAISLADIRKRIHEVKLEMEGVGATFLFAATVPRTVIKGAYWRSDGRFALDWSYQPRQRF